MNDPNVFICFIIGWIGLLVYSSEKDGLGWQILGGAMLIITILSIWIINLPVNY